MEYLNLILACQKVIWGISSCYRLCQSWLIQQTSTLVVARRRLHPSHYFSMEVHNTVRSHVFLLPDTSIQGSMKYCGVAILFRGIRVYTRSVMGLPCSETALEILCRVLADFIQKGCTQSLLMIIVKATHLKSSSLTGPTYSRPLATAVFVCLPLINIYRVWDFVPRSTLR